MYNDRYYLIYCFCSSISFMLQSGSSNGNCVANNNATLTVSYMEVGTAVWSSISTYYPKGN